MNASYKYLRCGLNGSVISLSQLSYFVVFNHKRRSFSKHSAFGLLSLASLFFLVFSSFSQAQTVATPTISPTSGSSYIQFNVTLTDATTGATIYYTLDGTTPTTASSQVASGGTVLISKSETLNAMAALSGSTNSGVASASYEVTGQLAGGEYHTIALRKDGSVWAWGYNNDGQIGDNTTTQRASAVNVSTLSGIVAVAAGAYHSLALDSGGHVWAWGLNSSGQCGDNTTTERKAPVEVQKSNGSGGTTALTNIVAICAGGYHNLALDSSGNVWAWGLNSNGQLGDGSTTQRNMAEEITSLSGVAVQGLYAGEYHSMLVTTTGAVMAWGSNSNGQVGDGTTTQRNSPVSISFSGIGSNTILALSGGAEHTVALGSDGTVWTWGYNSSGQLGNGTTTQSNSPVHLTSLSGVTAVQAGYTHTLALSSGTLWSWGTNAAGELGNGTDNQSDSPVQVSGLSGIVQVVAGNEDTLALQSNGTVAVFGADNTDQLGDGVPTSSPVMVPILSIPTPVQQISNGMEHSSLALDRSGNVWGWGLNSHGQLGDGTNFERVNAVQASFTGLGSASIATIACSGFRSMALDSNGSVWTWGVEPIGNGTTTDALQPVHLGAFSGSSTITAVAEGGSHSMAVDSSGHVWTWGVNGEGALGINSYSQRNTPTEVDNYSGGTGTYLSGVTAVAAGDLHSLALIGGAVYGWGYNGYGELGIGSTASQLIPVPVTGLSGVTIVSIFAGYSFSAAIDSNGHLWCWGYNNFGACGNSAASNPQTTPVEVTNSDGSYLSNVVSVHIGEYYCTAVESNGTAWSWGFNGANNLGDGTNIQRAHPVQVLNLAGATQAGGGYNFGVALKLDGTLQSWGTDGTGGLGAQANYAFPFVIPGFNALTTITPTVSITAPINNATVALGSPQTATASASETGGTIASVSYYINSTLVGTSTTGSSYSLTDIATTWGNYTITAIATDTLGNTSYLSAPIIVQVPYVVAPTNVTVVLGSTTATVSWTDAGTGIVSFVVQGSVDGGVTWTTLSTVSGTATSAPVTGLTLGANYIFRVIANSSVGASSAVSDAAPTITLTTPAGASLVP
jgi:alpha-tubulin suppressor-like RCC1 family protein